MTMLQEYEQDNPIMPELQISTLENLRLLEGLDITRYTRFYASFVMI